MMKIRTWTLIGFMGELGVDDEAWVLPSDIPFLAPLYSCDEPSMSNAADCGAFKRCRRI